MKPISPEILDLEEKQVAAFNRGDIDEILKFFYADIVGFSSTKYERISGLQSMRETFEYYLDEAEKIEYSISEPTVQVFGETAILTYYWLVTLINGAKKQEVKGRGSHVYVRVNGEWKIVHEHFSRAHHAYEKK
jgi:ketosteroid isomerase-like protein